MKKLLFSGLLSLALIPVVDAQRLQVYEEFTGENCPPCATTNPPLHALIDANSSDIFIISYQVNIPSAGPLYLQNPTPVDTRRAYYGTTSAPNGRSDGRILASNGHPAAFTQADITARAAVAAPFDITLSHTLNATATEVSVSVTVTNNSGAMFNAGAAGSLKLHVLLMEEELHFPTPPGTNGETEFVNVMVDMYPDAGGTTLQDAWAMGASQTFTFSNQTIPSYVYDLSGLQVGAFVQDDAANGSFPAKIVHQGALSTPVPLPPGLADVSVSNTTTGTGLCANTIAAPTVDLKNEGTAPITAAVVELLLNGSVVQTQNFTGSIAVNGTQSVSFNTVNLNAGVNNISYNVTSVNGGPDYNKLNNIDPGVAVAVIDPTPATAPYNQAHYENYSLGDVPADMIVDAPAGRVFVVDRGINTQVVSWDLGAFEWSTNCLRFDYWTLADGVVSTLTSKKVDLSSGTNSELSFDYAYAQLDATTADAFAVQVSKDCGATWTTVFNESGASLATAPNSSNRFYPRAGDWKREKISLAAFNGEPEVIVQFVATSAFGNSLYFDNAIVDGQPVISIDENAANTIKFYPNPASDRLFIEPATNSNDDVQVTLVNTAGQLVLDAVYSGSETIELSTKDFDNGAYVLTIKAGEVITTESLMIAK